MVVALTLSVLFALLVTGVVASSKTKALPPAWVIVDASAPAYTVFTSLPGDLPAAQMEKVKSGIVARKGVDLISWEEFRAAAEGQIAGRIVKNEYPDVKLALGVIELLVLYPGTPFGVAWNGGIAFTAGDYSFAEKIHRKYLDDSEQYERLRNRDPKSDPLHPSHHFSALLATK